jgi:hypothetical protein
MKENSNLTWAQVFDGSALTAGTLTTNPNYLQGTTLLGTTTSYSTLTINNNNNMNQQVKVAVFKVTRNDKNEVTSSSFINEYWIEKKTGTSIDFAVAKLIGDKYEADELVIRELATVTM